MQAYLSFFDKLNKLIENVGYETKYKLALNICQKLYPDFVNYAFKNNSGDAALLKDAIVFCEQSQSESINLEMLDNLILKIASIIPDSNDFLNWNVSYAVNASTAVLELLSFLKDSKDEHISEICSLQIDSIDFKIAEANENISDDGIFKHPMMLETMKEILDQII